MQERVRKRSNGEGTVRFNESRRRWEARITVGTDRSGAPIRRMVTGKTKRDVLARKAALEDATSQGLAPARSDLTLGRFLDTWLAEVVPGTVAPGTLQQYRDVVRLYVRPHLGRQRLAQLSALDVSRMLRALENEGRSPNTRRSARSVLRRSLRYAEAEGLVARNVAAIADGVRVGSSEGRTLSPSEAHALLNAARGSRLEASFTVALALGLRRGELLGLSWDDVDLAGQVPRLTVRRSLKRLPELGLHVDDVKTRTSRRTVVIPNAALRVLNRHRSRQAQERLRAGEAWIERPLGLDLVFRTETGTPVDPDNFRRLTYRITEAAGLGRWSPHELRHSAASLLIAQGVPLKLISELLGHSSIRVTADVYGHLLDESRGEVAAAMDRILGT